MAKLLKLPSQRKETPSVCTFGSQGPRNIETYVVYFSIIIKNGTQLSLQAYVLNQITSPIQRGPLQQLDFKFLQSISSTRLADVIPKSSEMASIYDGERYQVRWPRKSGEHDLSDNYDVAFG